ncbi:MAG: nitroreductase family protein [Bacillota bacterium]
MDIYDAIATRKTIRDFDGRPVDRPTLTKIIEAGMKAPCGGMLRTWHFIVVEDMQTRLEALSEIGERSTEDAARIVNSSGISDANQRDLYVAVIPKQRRMLVNAGALVVPCFRQPKPLLKPASLGDLDALASMWCCIENMMLAATAEGVFGVTAVFGDLQMARAKTVLGVPEDYEVPCFIGLGYPAPDAKRVKQPPIDLSQRLHFNKW